MSRRGTADCERAHQPAGAPVERDEAAFGDRTVHDADLVVRRRSPRRTGSWRRTGPTRSTGPGAKGSAPAPASRARGRGRALFGGVGPVLDAHVGAEERVVPSGDVARRDDAGGRREAGGVADDAVLERQPRSLQPRRLRRDPDADDDEVGVDGAAVAQAHALDPTVAVEAGDRDADTQVDAVVAVELAAGRAHLVAERPRERDGQRLEQGHVEPPAPARGRDLGADEAGADHDHPRARRPARREWPSSRRASGARGCPRGRACPAARRGDAPGRDDEAVEGDALAVVEHDDSRRRARVRSPRRPSRRSSASGS